MESKLLYGLHTAWLAKAERRKLDGFQARCLRRILNIPPSYYSRVSNNSVLSTAGVRKLSDRLLEAQLLLFGKAARAPEGYPLHECVFEGNGVNVRGHAGNRRRGRPRMTWATEVHREALKACNDELQTCILNEQMWKKIVHKFCGTRPSEA